LGVGQTRIAVIVLVETGVPFVIYGVATGGTPAFPLEIDTRYTPLSYFIQLGGDTTVTNADLIPMQIHARSYDKAPITAPINRISTPLLKGSTTAGTVSHTIRTATYYTIGDLVYIDILITISSKSTMAGNLLVDTLNAGAVNGIDLGKKYDLNLTIISGFTGLSANSLYATITNEVISGIDDVHIELNSTSATGEVALTDADITDSGSFRIQGVYKNT